MSLRIPLGSPALMTAFKVAAIATMVLMGAPARAAQSESESGPFSALYGNWTGAGLIKKANGSSERIRCRSTRAYPTPAGPPVKFLAPAPGKT